MFELDANLDTTASDIFTDMKILILGVSNFHSAVQKIDFTSFYDEIIAVKQQWPDNITDIPEVTTWRLAFKKMGLKPSKYYSSLESLIRRVNKVTDAWMTDIKCVDLYNSFSIRYGITLGGYDCQKISSMPLTVRTVNPDSDTFDPLGADASKYKLEQTQVVYAFGNEIACWALNHRDSKRFCLEENTENAIFCSEIVSSEQETSAFDGLSSMAELLRQNGADCSDIRILDKENPHNKLTLP